MTCPVNTDVSQAAAILKSGGLVAFATETVYGLGANALDPHAVARVFEVKARPRFDPLIVHLAEIGWIPRVASEFPETARRLAERFWPGPLTLVLPKTEAVPDLVTSGLPTVAVRVPDHPLALELLRATDLPIAAPSANPFGQLSPTRAEHVAEQLGDKIDYILDGGPCRVGVESTVLQLTEAGAVLLRPGGVAVEELEQHVGPIAIAESTDRPGTSAPAAPGMLPKHYAPRTPLQIVPTSAENDLSRKAGEQIGLLTLQPIDEPAPYAAIEVLSERGDLTEAAANFFAALRRLDARKLDRIVAIPFPEEGLGRALNDRLQRAARS